MADFKIRAFAGGKHPEVHPGELVLVTTHVGETSAYVEIEAYRSRMTRGEISHVELTDQRPLGDLTNTHVYSWTPIPWSWKRTATVASTDKE